MPSSRVFGSDVSAEDALLLYNSRHAPWSGHNRSDPALRWALCIQTGARILPDRSRDVRIIIGHRHVSRR